MRQIGAATAFIGVFILVTMAKRAPRPARMQTVFQWREMYSCPELLEQNLSVTLRTARYGDVYADTAWNVVYPAKRVSLLRQIIKMCREDGTNCEHFATWNSPMDGCAFLAEKHAFWSPAFGNIKPPFLCPVEAVRYVNMNWTVDKKLMLSLPFPRNMLFKDRLEIWNEKNQLTYCFILDFIWTYIKPRRNDQSQAQRLAEA